MNNDFRFVHREETFNDLAVRELAKGRSACICRIQFKRCTTDECEHCQINARFQECFDSMSDYDKQRLSSYIARQYVIDSRDPETWLSHKALFWYTLKNVLILTISLVVMFSTFIGVMCLVEGFPCDMPDSVVDQMIIDTLNVSHSQVWDLNFDGKVNCIDYAVTFKCIWDLKYPEYKNMCEIIRNKNDRTGMHHLFVRVINNRHFINIETWAKDTSKYLMEQNWKSGKYDARTNISGETMLWLKRCRRGIAYGFKI